MSKDFVVGRIVKMSDVPFHKGSAGYDFIAAQRRKEAEAILAAEHRVAEAALEIRWSSDRVDADIYFAGLEARRRLRTALDELRKLKEER